MSPSSAQPTDPSPFSRRRSARLGNGCDLKPSRENALKVWPTNLTALLRVTRNPLTRLDGGKTPFILNLGSG